MGEETQLARFERDYEHIHQQAVEIERKMEQAKGALTYLRARINELKGKESSGQKITPIKQRNNGRIPRDAKGRYARRRAADSTLAAS